VKGRLPRIVQRFQPETRDRLDELAELASQVLRREVSRAAVVRAVVCVGLANTANADPALLIQAIRDAEVPRGRKAKSPS